MASPHERLEQFLQEWKSDENGGRKTFLALEELLEGLPEVELDFVERPGVTYSLRARHARQADRPLFAMVDVIEDDPRWLSVCFYAEMIDDPEQQGDIVPGGLLGEDGHCFDVEEYEQARVDYLKTRLQEAWRSAGS